MTQTEIAELIALFDGSTAHTMKLSMPDLTLELSRAPQGTASPLPAPSPAPAAAVQETPGETGLWVRAPLVGTFYAAPEPGKAPFVQPGDRVEEGQTLCLIEAMKMMCQVAAPCACVIREVLPQDGDLLEYDAPLFRYQVV